MRKQVIVAALALASATAHAAASDDALVDDGSRKLQSGDTAGALAVFGQAKKMAPKDPRPHYLSALALQKQGDAAAAEREYRAALALDPQLADVRNELGALLLERGRFADAAVELKAAVQLKPELGEGWYNLGKAAMRQKDCATAVDAFGRASKLAAGDVDTLIDLSGAQRSCKQTAEALASARQAVKLAARSPDAHLNLAFALDSADKLDDAAAEATIATKLGSSSGTAWWALGTIERRRKRPDASIAALDKARQLKQSPAITDDLGVAWRDKGDLPRATAIFREALAQNPRYTPARWHLAETLAAQKQCAEVSRLLAQLPPGEQKSEPARKLASTCK
jgi:Tfp pilus assembly protein PilF